MHDVIAGTKATIAKLRKEIAGHNADAAELAAKLAPPAKHLQSLEAKEATLLRNLDALRGEMSGVRDACADIDAERARHAAAALSKGQAAEYYERTTLPDLERMLSVPPAGEVIADVPVYRSPDWSKEHDDWDEDAERAEQAREATGGTYRKPAPKVDTLAPLPDLGAKDSRAEVAPHLPDTRPEVMTRVVPVVTKGEPVPHLPDRTRPDVPATELADYGHLRGRAVVVHWIDGRRDTGVLDGYTRDVVILSDGRGGVVEIVRSAIDDVVPVPDPAPGVLVSGSPLTTLASPEAQPEPEPSTETGKIRALIDKAADAVGLGHREDGDGTGENGDDQ